MIKTGAQILVSELINHGVDTVFGYPGGAVLTLYDELYKNSEKIHHVLAAHEQGATHAADGYARISGKVGVVISTSGPGATNLVTGIANAYLDSVPLVAITGNVAVPLLGRDSFQEVDIVGITQPIVKHNFIVRKISELESVIKEAFKIASSGRKGPVLIDIPKCVQADKMEYTMTPIIQNISETSCVENDYTMAIEAIKLSKKPYIYCGGGVLSSGAEQEVLELSKKLSAPVGMSMMGLTALPEAYELNLGMTGMHGRYAGSKAQSECDLMIAVGVRFSDRATGKVSEYTKNCTVIHIDIDNAEINKNIVSKISLCGDAKNILQNLLGKVGEMRNDDWLNDINEYKKVDELPKNNEFRPQNIIETVNKNVPMDTVIATDVGQHQMWTMQYYRFNSPRKLLTSAGHGTMGYGLGAAIGGCLANGKKRTILFTSDGSFGMNLNEMATAVSEKLPIVVVLLNNSVLGMIRQWQGLFYQERYSHSILNRKTDFPLLAKAFGADGYSVDSISGLIEVLNNLSDDSPTLIDCKIDLNEKVFPMIPPNGTINDITLKEGDEQWKKILR